MVMSDAHAGRVLGMVNSLPVLALPGPSEAMKTIKSKRGFYVDVDVVSDLFFLCSIMIS